MLCRDVARAFFGFSMACSRGAVTTLLITSHRLRCSQTRHRAVFEQWHVVLHIFKSQYIVTVYKIYCI
jgi:hypothetical protein